MGQGSTYGDIPGGELIAAGGGGVSSQLRHAPRLASPVPIAVAVVLLFVSWILLASALPKRITYLSSADHVPVTVDDRGRVLIPAPAAGRETYISILRPQGNRVPSNRTLSVGPQSDLSINTPVSGCRWMTETDVQSQQLFAQCSKAMRPQAYSAALVENVQNGAERIIEGGEAKELLRDASFVVVDEQSVQQGVEKGAIAQSMLVMLSGLVVLAWGIRRRRASNRALDAYKAALESRANAPVVLRGVGDPPGVGDPGVVSE